MLRPNACIKPIVLLGSGDRPDHQTMGLLMDLLIGPYVKVTNRKVKTFVSFYRLLLIAIHCIWASHGLANKQRILLMPDVNQHNNK